MFSGGDYEEVGRWLWNFVISHAKRENPRVEAIVDAEGPREGRSYGIRLSLGPPPHPAPGSPAARARLRGGGPGARQPDLVPELGGAHTRPRPGAVDADREVRKSA